MKSVSVKARFSYSINGQPTPYEGQATTLDLPVTDELVKAEGTIRWRIGVSIPEAFQRQKGITVRSVAEAFPVELSMDAGTLRSLLVSEEPGTANIELPLRVQCEQGKEVIRDEAGRMTGVVPRYFADVSWDKQ